PPMAHRQNHCRSGPCPRIGSKEKAPANSHLQGLLCKWSQPLSPGCSEESSWTVTVHGRNRLQAQRKSTCKFTFEGAFRCKRSQPLSPGCSEESSWTVTVHGWNRLQAQRKSSCKFTFAGAFRCKRSQPLSPGCSEESSWTVTVQDRTGETLAKKKPLQIHICRGF